MLDGNTAALNEYERKQAEAELNGTLSKDELDLAVHDAIVHPDLHCEQTAILEAVDQCMPQISALYKQIDFKDSDYSIRNANLIVTRARELCRELHSLVSDHLGGC